MARKAGEKGDVPGIDVLGSDGAHRPGGTPDDIAATTAFLCSEDGAYITGQIIGVNGGMYI